MRPPIYRTLTIAATAAAALALTGAAAPGSACPPPGAPTGYVTNSGSGDVTPFNAVTGSPGDPISITGSPGAIVIAPNGKTAYIASTAGVTPVSTTTSTAGRLIPLKNGAASMVITPNGKSLYVTSHNPSTTRNTVTPISTATGKAGKPITFTPGVGSSPSPLVVTPDGKTLYVASALGAVTPVNVLTGHAGKPIAFGFKDPSGIAHLAITPDGRTVYAFGSAVGKAVKTVTPICTATGKAGRPVRVGQGPEAIVFSPDSKMAYVASTGEGLNGRLAGATVTPIRTTTGKTGQVIRLGPTATDVYMAIMPNGRKIYVSALWRDTSISGQVISISTATRKILARARPSYPRAITFTPDGKTAYIIDTAANAWGVVVSITTATDTYHPGFWVGRDPVAIAIAP